MYTISNPASSNPARRRNRRTLVVGVGLAATSLFGLAACGDDDADADSPATTEAPATTDAPDAPTTDAPTTDAPASDAPEGTLLEVVATDYHFDGLPTELAAGSYTLTFDNQGAEEHEIVLFKNIEGLSMEELAAMGPDEAMSHIEMAGILFASPGESAAEPMPLELSAGEYVATCFIPAATDGAPHFTHGMTQTVTVA